MLKSLAQLLILAALLCAACGRKEETRTVYREGEPPVTFVKESDPEMAAAVKKAKDGLDGFIKELQSPRGREFTIKAGLPTSDGGMEHIWIDSPTYSSGRFKGNLANEPLDLPGKKLGDPVEVSREDVSDWAIWDGQEMTGGFTVDVLLKRQGNK